MPLSATQRSKLPSFRRLSVSLAGSNAEKPDPHFLVGYATRVSIAFSNCMCKSFQFSSLIIDVR